MKAMVLQRICNVREEARPLALVEIARPEPAAGEILIKISCCGVCHTELDEIEGRALPPQLPVVLGHQAVGRVESLGTGAVQFAVGERVGVAWIFSACGNCSACRRGDENLCDHFRATGRDANGGYAEYMTVSEAFAHRIPDLFSDAEAAPHLCAGAIGYRSLRLTGLTDGQALGLTGFGASAHLVLLMVKHRYPQCRVYVFARDESQQSYARELGATWAGNTEDTSPEPLDCVIDTTPAWKPVREALRNLKPRGRLVINAIRKEERDKNELLALDYPAHLWREKEIKSVANVTRRDVIDFLQLAAEIPIRPEIEIYPLQEANRALHDLVSGRIRGSKVLQIS